MICKLLMFFVCFYKFGGPYNPRSKTLHLCHQELTGLNFQICLFTEILHQANKWKEWFYIYLFIYLWNWFIVVGLSKNHIPVFWTVNFIKKGVLTNVMPPGQMVPRYPQNGPSFLLWKWTQWNIDSEEELCLYQLVRNPHFCLWLVSNQHSHPPFSQRGRDWSRFL